MADPKPRLRLIAGRPVSDKPRVRMVPAQPAAKTMQERLSDAIAYLRRRGIYVLDKGSPKPNWGVPGKGRA